MLGLPFFFLKCITEVYLKLCQTTMMKRFWKNLLIFAKGYIINVWQDAKCASLLSYYVASNAKKNGALVYTK